MKKIIITCLIVLSIASAHAQPDPADGRGGKHGMKHRGDPVAHLTEKLDLSDEQTIEVDSIFEASRAQHRAIQESVRDEHCALRDETLSELAMVLDENQLAEFEAMQNERKNRGRNHGMPRFADCDS